VITVIPLVMIQIPGTVAWVVPPRVAAAGPAAVASLLRAGGPADPGRGGPLGGLTRTVALIGADRALHGAGAGIAMAGVVAVVAERRPRRRPQTAGTERGRRALARCWAAFTVAGLATAPEPC
jgi:hypothetical protein